MINFDQREEFFCQNSYIVLWVCSFHTFFFLQIPHVPRKTNFVYSFRQKVVLVASYVCLASRERQKWYLGYLQDILSYLQKITVKTLLLRVPFFFHSFWKKLGTRSTFFWRCFGHINYAYNFKMLCNNNYDVMI